MAKILIITNGALCRNPRIVKEATALGRAGYAVTVLGVNNHAPSEAVDAGLMRGAPFRREVVNVLAPGLTGFRYRLSAWLARKGTVALNWQTPRGLGPVRAQLQRARTLEADLTIVHNEGPHYIGTRLLADGRRVCADIEDWHSEDLMPQDRVSRPQRLLRQVEATLLNRCIHTTTTSLALAEALQARYGGARPHVITNSFPLQPAPAHPVTDQPPAFFWFSQTLGPGRGLEHFLAAWARTTRPSRLVLLGEARRGFDENVRERLPERLRAQVSLLPLVPPGDLPALIARHDIGLALEQTFIVNRNLIITNKIIQYLNAGLAVVASDTAGQREVLARDPRAGIVVETHETTAFARALDELIADRAALAARQQAARRLAEDVYCWEREEPRLLELVARALRAKPTATQNA